MFWFITFLIILLLISFNALYVAAEFSTVSSRRSRLSQQVEQGNQLAETILGIVEDSKKLDAYVATCQVGITISSLVLGYYGQAQLPAVIAPIFSSFGNFTDLAAKSFSATVILVLLSLLQVLFGELVPKNIAIQYPEKLAIFTAIPMRWSGIIFRPLIWLFNGSGILLMRLLKLETSKEHTHIHSPEEIAFLVEESGVGGVLKNEEHRLLKNILIMRDVMVRKVMIPRARMLAAPITQTPMHLFSLVADSPYSRIPIYRESIDNILGVIHIRDLLCFIQQKREAGIQEILHSVPFVPESMLVKDVLSLLQKKQFQVAIVLDEFGGTTGMVTLEDILEEIFGDLKDEFDTENPLFQILPGNKVLIRGDMLIEQVNEFLNIELPIDQIDTIGGLVLNTIGYVPIINDEIEINGNKFRVEKMSGRGVAMVSFLASPKIIKNIQDRYM